MNLSFLPNLITIIRILLLIPLTFFLYQKDYTLALIIFVIAGFSDALDGFLAKQFSWTSRFGAILDPLADKALLVLTMSILAYNQQISWLLLTTVFLRDIYIVAGAYYFHYRLGPYDMQPSNLSKLNTFTQLFLVTCILVSMGFKALSPVFLDVLVILTYITTISSGVHYGLVWGKKFRVELAKKKNTDLVKTNKNESEGS